ncbi:ACP-like protein [Glarea lozoyensis ATCC 20868]|uniref:Acyl carrier protein n=1 Tax=Glarea lozoyensis (strain ATCC 20868 / MF5171) TaxID=1116229 RepID=S3DK86_GLAL2|nr:ACP-like protein [Glarea lozoyensis ATCC 20868]EPE26958.1 ACP-like protein [Glarea lozoyensis ATCC 20868]
MFRTALLKSARSATCQAVRWSAPIARPAVSGAFVTKSQFAPTAFQGLRCYSAAAGLKKQEVEGRIVDLLKNFDKVTDPSKITSTSHFANDLALDSLDTVEVVMAIEEEFSIEIPDKEADAIHSIDKAVEYILAQPDGG